MLLNIEFVLLLILGNLGSYGRSSLISLWRDRDIRKGVHLCPQRWELMGAIRTGGPLRSLIHPNHTIVLQCRFCEDPEDNEDDDDIGMWTFVNIVRGSAPVRVPAVDDKRTASKGNFLGFGRMPRIVQTEDRSLALRKPRTTDLGLYQCRRDGDNSSIGSTVRYLIDMDIALYEGQLKREKESDMNERDKEDEDYEDNESTTTESRAVKDEENDIANEIPYINGTFADWPTYQKTHLHALDEFITISGLHLEAISEWTSWTECKHCWTTKYGVRARRGVCVLRLPLRESEAEDAIVKELAGLPALACRSALLSGLHPKVSDEARKVPDFVEFDYRGCNGVCVRNDSKSRGSILHRLVYLFRHRRDAPLMVHKRLTINSGEALVLVCPKSTAETPVHWQKDGESIEGGSVQARKLDKRNPVQRIITKMRQAEHWVSGEVAGIKAEPDNNPLVDSAGVLKIKKAAPRNSGNYECSVNGTPRGTFQVEVIVRSTLSFDDIMRHFAYVSLVLLSCIMIWCGVIICVSLQERLQKNKYRKLPQTSQPARPSSPPNTSESRADTPKDNEEPSEDNTASADRRTHKPATEHPSRRASRAGTTDSPKPSPPQTASYHKVPSRLRVRHLSRLISRPSSNNDMELAQLLPHKSSMHLPKNRSDHPGPPRRYRCRQYSCASTTSADLDDIATPVDKGSVILLSQQLFPASQKELRPVPSTVQSRNTVEPVSTLLSVGERIRSVSVSPPAWVPSAISASVLRARNSLRPIQASSTNTSHLNKSAYMDDTPALRSNRKEGNTRADTHKRPKKRQSKSNIKPRKTRPRATKSPPWKKHCGPSSPSSVRKKPTLTARPKTSPGPISLNKSSLSRLTASPICVSKKSSPVRPESSRSPSKSSPRLSLLYKALPSPKPAASSSVSRDHLSSMSFLSNSAGYSTTDQHDVFFDKPTSAEIITSELASPNDRAKSSEGSLLEKLTKQQPDVLVSKQTPTLDTLPIQSLPKVRLPDSYPQPPDGMSMFEIKTDETPTKPCFSELLSHTPLSRQHSIANTTAPIAPCDSLEKLKLVAAFLETSEHRKKSVTPSRSKSKSTQEPKSTSQGSFLKPPSVILASPRQSETNFPPSPTVKSSTPSCSAAKAESAFSLRGELLKAPSLHEPPLQKSSTFSRRKFPIQSKQTATKVSRQLLPAIISPCAIALLDHAPVVNKLIKAGSLLHPTEHSPLLEKLKTAPSSRSSVRSSTSTQFAFNPMTEIREMRLPPEKRSVSPPNADSVLSLRVEDEQKRVSDRSIRSKSSVKDLQPQQGRASGMSVFPPPKEVESFLSLEFRSADQFTAFRETRSEDIFRSSPTRFRTPRSETANCASAHSDCLAAHHSSKMPISAKDRLKSDKEAKTTLRKLASTRYCKHKGYFVRQKPEVNKFQIILVDTDKLKKENSKSEQNGSSQREAPTQMRPKSRGTVFDSVTQSVAPATAIAFPQIVSARPLWSVHPSTSGSKPISNEPQPSETHFQPISKTTQELIRSRSQELETVAPKKKPSKLTRSKLSINKERNRIKKSSHVNMSAITGPIEFKFKQGVKHNIEETTKHPLLSSTGSFDSPGRLDQGFLPYSLSLKVTQSLPQASRSPSLRKFIGTPGVVSKSFCEVQAKPALKSSTLRPITPLYLHENSRFANQLLVREPSSLSSHTTQVEKGDIDQTCDAEVQSVVCSAHSTEQAVQRSCTVLRDESTSFGSLCDSMAKWKRVRLATAEMASQVSDILTSEEPKRSGSQTFVTNPSPKERKRKKDKSQPTTALGFQRNDNRTIIKGRATKQRMGVPPCQSSDASPHDAPAALPSRLPIPVKKFIPGAAKPPLHPVPKTTLTRTLRKPLVPTLKPITPRTEPGKLSPKPRRSPQTPEQTRRQEGPILNLRSSRHLAQTSPRPLKSGILRNAAKEKEATTKPITVDYNSHHTILPPQTIEEKTNPEHSEQKSAQSSHLYAESFLDSPKPPSSSMHKTDPIQPANRKALADSAQGIIAIPTTQKVPFTPPVRNQRLTRISEPDTQRSVPGSSSTLAITSTPVEMQSKEETNNAQPTVKTKRNEKIKRNQIRRLSTSVPRSLKIAPFVRRNSPSPTRPNFYAFEAPKQSRGASSNDLAPRLDTRSILTGARNLTCSVQNVQSSTTCPDFLQDGFMSVRGISAIEYERKKKKFKEDLQ